MPVRAALTGNRVAAATCYSGALNWVTPLPRVLIIPVHHLGFSFSGFQGVGVVTNFPPLQLKRAVGTIGEHLREQTSTLIPYLTPA